MNWIVYLATDNTLSFYLDGHHASTGAVPIAAWSYIALIRNGNTLTFYIDGIASGTMDMTGITVTTTGGIAIGGIGAGMLGTNSWGDSGYLEDVRIDRVARYTGNFTPPVSPETP